MSNHLVLATVLLCGIAANAASAQNVERANAEAWQQFQQQEGSGWEIRTGERTATPSAVLFGLSQSYAGTPELAAREFLSAHADVFHINATPSSLRHDRTLTINGVHHVRFQQVYEGIPVEGAEYLVHVREDGRIVMANGDYYSRLVVSSIRPARSASEVISRALSDLGRAGDQSKPELVIFPSEEGGGLTYRLAWKSLVGLPDNPRTLIVDANTGLVLRDQSLVVDAYQTGSYETDDGAEAVSLLSQPVVMHPLFDQESAVAWAASMPTPQGNVYLQHPGLTPNISNVTLSNLRNLGTGTYSLTDSYFLSVWNLSTSSQYTSGSGNFNFSTTSPYLESVNIYYHTQRIRNFFNSMGFPYDGINSRRIESHWNGSTGYYAGDPRTGVIRFGSRPDNLSPAEIGYEDKVVMHEYVHAVFDYISGVRNSDNSQAASINEGIADYFAGALTGRPAILEWGAPMYSRNMATPTGNNLSNPNSTPITTYQQYSDASGPNNVGVEPHRGGEFFSYILWGLRAGGTITPNVARLDRIVFDALAYVNGSVDFIGFRDAMITAENALGGQNRAAILNAFSARGITGGRPPAAVLYTNISGPTCQDPSGPANFQRGNFGGGRDPYITTWLWRPICGVAALPCNSWAGGTQNTSTFQTFHDYDYEVAMHVRDADGVTGMSNVIYVGYSPGGCGGGVLGRGTSDSTSTATTASVSVSSARVEDAEIMEVALSLPRPNPAQGRTTLSVSLPETANVSVFVTDVMGRNVLEIPTVSTGAGQHEINVLTSRLAAGAYRITVRVEINGAGQVLLNRSLTVVR